MRKNNVKLTTVLVLFLLGGLFLSINSNSLTSIAKLTNDNSSNNPHLQAFTPHVPIYIEYDDNFTNPYGFPGTGSPGDPYRIENYDITVSGDYPILFSGNNTAHFIIQNCYLSTDSNYGIYLGKYYKMGEGTVNILNNVIISVTNRGILLNGGNYSVISGNNITSYDNGIDIDYSEFSVISENNINGGDEIGINAAYSHNSTITRNTILGHYTGIELSYTSDSIITHNNCSQHDGGIRSYNSDYNTITNNILIKNSDTGLDMWDSDFSVITNNLFQETTNYAIRLNPGDDNNKIHHNAFIDNNEGGVQAYDAGSNNIWYDDVALEGNYWNEWVSGSYSIDGAAGAVDPYPLVSIPVITEYSSLYTVTFLILALVAIPVINFANKKKRK